MADNYLHSENGALSDSSSFSGSGFGNNSAARTMHNEDNGELSPSIMTFCKKNKINETQLITLKERHTFHCGKNCL